MLSKPQRQAAPRSTQNPKQATRATKERRAWIFFCQRPPCGPGFVQAICFLVWGFSLHFLVFPLVSLHFLIFSWFSLLSHWFCLLCVATGFPNFSVGLPSFSIGRLPFSSLFPYFPWGFLSGTGLRGFFFSDFLVIFFLDTCLYVRNMEFLRKASVLGHITGQHSHHVWRGPKESEVISRR